MARWDEVQARMRRLPISDADLDEIALFLFSYFATVTEAPPSLEQVRDGLAEVFQR
jgi:hypothetical protein